MDANSPASTAFRERLRRWIPPLVLLLTPAALILRQLDSGHFLWGQDVANVFYYSYGTIGKALASGRWPVWDSHVLCGSPLLAGMNNGVLYPFTWLSAILSPGTFWTLSVAFHLSLAGFFARAWLEGGLSIGRWGALTASVAFMLSGFAITHLYGGHLSLVCAYPWGAAILWRLERFLVRPTVRRSALLSGSFVMMVLAGHPQMPMIGGLAAAARLMYFIFERRDDRKSRARTSLMALGALGIGGLLAAPQLIPTAELTQHTQRAAGGDYAFSTTYSFPPESLVTLVAPAFFGDSTTVPYWGRWRQTEVTGFLGIAALALAALGALGDHRQRRLWLGLAVAGLLLSMGRYTPVFKVFFHVVPGAGFFRGPARYLFLFTLAMVPLIGMGSDRFWSPDDRIRRHAVRVGAVAGALLVVVAGVLISLRSPEGGASARWKSALAFESSIASGERDEERLLRGQDFPQTSHELAVHSLSLAFQFLSGIVMALLACRWTPARWSGGALGGILLLELLAFDSRFILDHPEKEMRWPDAFVRNVEQHPLFPFRLATISESQGNSMGKCQLAGLDHVGGYDPMMLRRYAELILTANRAPSTGYVAAIWPAAPGPIYDLLGVRYWIIPGSKQLPPGWGDVGQIGNSFVYENPSALPRAFLVTRSVVIDSPEQRLRYLARPDFQPARELVLETGPEQAGSEAAPGTVTIEARAEGYYQLKADCAADAWLVLTEAHYPGWTAEIDGTPAPIVRADHLVQAVRVSRGSHAVTFRYRSGSFRLGWGVAGITVLLSFGGILILRRKKPV